MIELLRCPACTESFRLDADETLVCPRGHRYPVVRGVPRLVEPVSGEQRRTADAFGYFWGHYSLENPDTEEQWRDWVVPLGPDDFAGKLVFDAGCGLGGFAKYALRWGARRVVGVDLSSAIDAARERLGDSVELVQADLHRLPFAASPKPKIPL